jgi:hypothetical protein
MKQLSVLHHCRCVHCKKLQNGEGLTNLFHANFLVDARAYKFEECIGIRFNRRFSFLADQAHEVIPDLLGAFLMTLWDQSLELIVHVDPETEDVRGNSVEVLIGCLFGA